ncbi:MAG: hypothetical protein ACXU81_10755 [Myxococcaceae bacterium]
MTFRKRWWLVVPLAAGLGCAGAQQAQKETKAGGNATLVDEGPASASAQAGAAGAAAGQGAASQLVPFQGKNGYTVLMPPNPQTNDRTQDTPGGQVQVHIAQAQDPAGKYLSTLSEFPKGSLDRIKSKDLLDSLQQATIQSMGGTLVNAQDVEVAGLPGREFTATDPEGSEVTARVFVGGSRVYTLAGTYRQGQQVPGSIQQFLGSFQPPAGTAMGGSGSAGDVSDSAGSASAGAAAGDTMSAASPDEPTTKSKKHSRRSSSTSSTTESSSADTGPASGSR